MNIPSRPPQIIFKDTFLGRGNPVFIIAELGTSHGGDKEKAFSMIKAAWQAGADCIKFQLVIAEEIVHPKTGLVSLPGGKIPLYERFKTLEQDLSFYREIKDYTESLGIPFLCTAFGLHSARMLKEIGVKILKVASPEVNHLPLLSELSEYNLPVLVSCGVSLLSDLEEAVSFFPGRCALLHCVTAYPAPEEEYNLSLLPSLSSLFGVPVGVSDHSLDPLLVPVLSTALGGSIIEKHFTLSKTGSGLDDPIALTPEEFRRMTDGVRRAETLGTKETLAWISDQYGEKRVQAVLGYGIKQLAPSERENYLTTNRSVIARRDLKAGEYLTEENCAILRSEKNLKPGLHPRFHRIILGKRIQRDLESGRGITWEDLLEG